MSEAPSAIESAVELARDGAAAGTCVLAHAQEDAVTRMDHRWISPEGGLYLAYVARPKVPMQQLTALPYLAQLAVLDALRAAGVGDASLGWPNDVLLGGKKLGCTAVKAGVGEGGLFAAVGVNLNVADAPELHSLARPGDFATANPQPATSLEAAGYQLTVDDLAAPLRESLKHRLATWEQNVAAGQANAGPLQPFLSEYFDELSVLSKLCNAFYPDGRLANSGIAVGIDLWARLTIRSENGSDHGFAPEQVTLRQAK